MTTTPAGCERCSYSDSGCMFCRQVPATQRLAEDEGFETAVSDGHTITCATARAMNVPCPVRCPCECHHAPAG